jgi:hypothetical protein
MTAFLIISSIFTPPLVWLLIFFKILPPKGKTKGWAQLDLVICTLKHPMFWAWVLWVAFWLYLVITAGGF